MTEQLTIADVLKVPGIRDSLVSIAVLRSSGDVDSYGFLPGISEYERLALPDITGVSMDSRTISFGDLYIARAGANAHGARFIATLRDIGLSGIVTDPAGLDLLSGNAGVNDVPVLVLSEVLPLVGAISRAVYGNSTGKPEVIGVTGTNGKTTTTYFVEAAFRALGRRTGLIGTIETVVAGQRRPSTFTTPEATELHKLIAQMRSEQVDNTVMEVSSHAIALHRVDALDYAVVGFTNLTQDHLDFHGTMEDYYQAKKALFTPEHSRKGVVVANDVWGKRLSREAEVPTVSLVTLPVALKDDEDFTPDWQVTDMEESPAGSSFVLASRDGQRIPIHVGLPGEFNVSNAALAAVLLIQAGVSPGQVQELACAEGAFYRAVPGRMERIADKPRTIVDFAHNPDALDKVLRGLRATTSGKLITVFGATGNRDQSKRPVMGALAAELSDVVVVTDDDPHSEDPVAIRSDVMAGVQEFLKDNPADTIVHEVAPRDVAIELAVSLADSSDTILLAGRGHEGHQDFDGRKVLIDDREEARTALAKYFQVSPKDSDVTETTPAVEVKGR